MTDVSRPKHQLVKHNARFECQVCSRTWNSRPRTPCPGVRIYPRYDYSPLLSQEQLKYLSYETSARFLPVPVGCYYSGAGVYVYLYDPAQAIKRKTPIRRRTRALVTDVYWPISLSPVLANMSKFLEQRKSHDYREYQTLSHEIAEMAAAFHAFTPEEVEQLSGGSLHLAISPCLIRRAYPLNQANDGEQIKLATYIAVSYGKHMTSV